ncbi:ribosome biogenesis GTPase Der [Wolinella succinogenes]|uniref:GTPase Der n=1 Tax=Wolinella succinogenes (strain ATCC 29543 / DSM 1740 / CCUG 13145 / JCM 31913 / LMG 7466 / NCTC 11488 / FDC 602W) TaxID=273121 RepID=DER_WOLSU|nr:ribosome biogenesis GTPase Der [Wolinella succinogenes]Q7M7W8.1 RecName: Full=GTPase Der; AltName: Full=GTP-binding protein EngA [Wolinella succinogenes DSM 1740]HCZ19099.1 ribosome biogenesis GTPase Der [Helicobacter sp.]NLU34089.1 ribosome biogenesis GTPase Der [Wolinella succinogenes]CAE11040.1 PUTATIVE GTP-BINDING PROTEIN [Wolinella succinogenes]VEG81205.1 GTP-binding protein EngA [Wolinella succinogenes]
MKTIAIIGKPNVGKSSLFNRLAKERIAITSDVSGTTRDIKKQVIEIEGNEVLLVDTGGIELKETGLFGKVRELALRAAKEADVVLYMVDGKMRPQDDDISLFRALHRENEHLFLVVNKIDNDKEKERGWEFAEFGAEKLLFISVSHNRGVGALQREIADVLGLEAPQEIVLSEDDEEDLEEYLVSLEEEEIEEIEEAPSEIRVGIIGKVNVGKSSLLNALLGSERSVVSDVAGTTIDPVDESMEIEGQKVLFVDTAGIRRRGKIEGIEKYALDRTQKALEKADIALLVLDCSLPFADLDEKIGGLVDKFSLGVIVVLNKWDIRSREFKEVEKEVRHRFKYLEHAPLVTVSAQNGRHIDMLKEKILKVYENFSRRIPTSILNKTIMEASARHPLPSDHGKIVRIYYATQYGVCPPQISLVMNRPNSLHFSYKRYVVNFLRDRFDFEGSPILIRARKRGEKLQDEIEALGED